MSDVKADRLEVLRAPDLERLEESLQQLIHKAFAGGGINGQKVKNFLNGTWLGEPLHVVLTDLPIGAWSVALLCDGLELITGKRTFAAAADTSIGIGLAGAAGSALTGLTDWQDVDGPARRLGFIHAILNVSATALFAASFVSRGRGSRQSGRWLAAMGFAAMTVAARLGGKMVYERGVGVDRTDGQALPADFVPVMAEKDLQESEPARAECDGTPVLLVRRGNRIFALSATCSHFGGPLDEGTLAGDSIVCPWHGSRFALKDGAVIDGPAVHPQPCLEARVLNGKIEVRKPPRTDPGN